MKVKLSIGAIPHQYEGKIEIELVAEFDNGNRIFIISSYVDESKRKYTFDGAYDYDGSEYEIYWEGKWYDNLDEDELRKIVGDSVVDAIFNWYKKSLQIDNVEKSVYLENLVDVYDDDDIFTAIEQWNEEQILTID